MEHSSGAQLVAGGVHVFYPFLSYMYHSEDMAIAMNVNVNVPLTLLAFDSCFGTV